MGLHLLELLQRIFYDVSIVTDKKDYNYLINELNKNKGATSLKFREEMASKAFGLTAYYDSMISNWFNKKLNIIFPEKKTIFGKKNYTIKIR